MAKAAKKDQVPNGSNELLVSDSTRDPALDGAVDMIIDVLDDLGLSPEGRAKRIISQIREMSFTAPGAATAMASDLRQFAENVKGLRLNHDDGRGLVQEAVKLLSRATELARPVPPPRVPQTVTEAMTAYQRVLCALGWNSIEVEFLAVELVRTHEALQSFDALGITTVSGRRITRYELRELNAPREAPWREKFFASLPKIPTTDSQLLEAKES